MEEVWKTNTKRSWKRLLQAERRKGQGKQFKLSSLCPGGRPWVKNSSCITCSPSSLCETVTFHAACSTGCQPLKPRVVRRVSNACPPMWSSLLCEYTCSTPSSATDGSHALFLHRTSFVRLITPTGAERSHGN